MRTRSVRVEDIIEDISMGPFGSDIKVECFTTSGVPLLNGSNLQKVRLIEEVENYVTEEKAQELKKALARPHDIVITHRGTLGQASYVPEGTPYPYYLISQSQFRVRFNAEEVYAPYIAYYLHSSEGQGKLLSFKNHVGVPALARATSNFRKLQFNLPEIDEQKRIANTLIAYDEKIEHNNELIKMLEEQAQLLYDYWFMQFDFPDENGRPYRSSGGKMVWSEELKREIPEGWDVDNITAVATIESGGTPSTKRDEYWNGHIPFYTPKDATDGFIATACTARYVTDIGVEESTTQVYERAVFLTARGTVGRVQMPRIPMAMNQSCYAICPRDGESLTLTYHMVKSIVAALKVRAHGAVFDAIITGDILSVKLPIPHRSLRQSYQQHTEAILKRLVDIAEEQERLTAQRDFLLPLLMSGQVTVAE